MRAPGAGFASAEMVTGERLQALADVTVLPAAISARLRARPERAVTFSAHRSIADDDLARISGARTIFVYTDAVGPFQEHIWPRLAGSGYVLVTHNSDAEVGAEHARWAEAADGLAHWFAQNLVVTHPKLSPLPLGLANASWPHGDAEAVAAAARTAPDDRPELVHARFDVTTHPDRERAMAAVQAAFPGIAAEEDTLPFPDYLAELARHRFCLCPRGNGIDTHRLWECLYLGVVPVVERSAHTERWAAEGLPLVLLDRWSDLSAERLMAESLPAAPAPADVLLLSHYVTMFEADVPR